LYSYLMIKRYSLTGNNQCNPSKLAWDGESDFPCEEGYYGRMCSQCESGYLITTNLLVSSLDDWNILCGWQEMPKVSVILQVHASFCVSNYVYSSGDDSWI
jgi:hypothetical protein